MRPVLQAVVTAVALGLALGCKPKIGDDCELDTDCSNSGDRLCDRSQPGGYCTIFNCEPGTCPDEATCIGFRTTLSALASDAGEWACLDPQQNSRLQRAFCMRRCKSNSDCRTGYECLDMRQPANPYGAVVLEDGGSGKVCVVPDTAEPLSYTDGVPGVCTGNPGDESLGGAPTATQSSSGGVAGQVNVGGGGGLAGAGGQRALGGGAGRAGAPAP